MSLGGIDKMAPGMEHYGTIRLPPLPSPPPPTSMLFFPGHQVRGLGAWQRQIHRSRNEMWQVMTSRSTADDLVRRPSSGGHSDAGVPGKDTRNIRGQFYGSPC